VNRKVDDLPIVLVPHPHVRVERTVLAGSPYVVGSRVPVRRLWGFYRSGATVDTLIRRYPKLGAAKIFDALAFAWDNAEVIEADIHRETALLDKDAQAGGDATKKPTTQMTLNFDAAPAPKTRAATRSVPAAKTASATKTASAVKPPAAKPSQKKTNVPVSPVSPRKR
jgi:uncharacterized protein (DUF433 family)